MSMEEPTRDPVTWTTLSHPFELQSQPQSSPKGTATMAPQIGPHGPQEFCHENRSTCQH